MVIIPRCKLFLWNYLSFKGRNSIQCFAQCELNAVRFKKVSQSVRDNSWPALEGPAITANYCIFITAIIPQWDKLIHFP